MPAVAKYSGRPPAHAEKLWLTPRNAPGMVGASSSEYAAPRPPPGGRVFPFVSFPSDFISGCISCALWRAARLREWRTRSHRLQAHCVLLRRQRRASIVLPSLPRVFH